MQDGFRTGGLKGQYAGFVSRLLAYGIDITVITLMLIAFAWLIDTVTRFFPTVRFNPEVAVGLVLASVVFVITAGSYFIFFWTLVGQTPGKMLLGVRVVSLNGTLPTFWQSFRRYIGYYLSALALYAGYWWVLIDNRRQSWHDKLAGTVVVYAWDARLDDLLADRVQRSQGIPEESE